jgi:pimeloyl-ACP methyl ester carboxylesterase
MSLPSGLLFAPVNAHFFYLHGFASSARSSKATFLARKLAERGMELHAPDFNEPDFSTLTVTRMVQQTCAAVDDVEGPVTLVGSSLGAFVAVQAAVQRPGRVVRLVLLAPAFEFGGNPMREMGESGLARWRETDRLDVFHYGYGRIVPVHYALYSDAARYDSFSARLDIPVLVFQGSRDTLVDPASVERWARGRPNVELHLLDDDHQLLGSLDYIWQKTSEFLTTSKSRRSSPESPPERPL